MALTEAIFLGAVGPYNAIDRDTRSEDFAYLLTRPVSYLWLRFFETTGRMLVRLPIFLVIGAVLVYGLTRAAPPIVHGAWYVLIGVVPFASVLQLIYDLSVLIGAAFWLGEAKAAYWFYGKFLMFFGGLFIPLAVFPHRIQVIAACTPFYYMLYKPASLLHTFSWRVLGETIGGISLWLLAGVLLLIGVYRASLRRVVVHGG